VQLPTKLIAAAGACFNSLPHLLRLIKNTERKRAQQRNSLCAARAHAAFLYEGPIKKFAAGAECDNCIKNLFLSGFLWAAESKGIKRATLSLFAARNYLDWRRSRKRASLRLTIASAGHIKQN
jgi:hypothetical protein